MPEFASKCVFSVVIAFSLGINTPLIPLVKHPNIPLGRITLKLLIVTALSLYRTNVILTLAYYAKGPIGPVF